MENRTPRILVVDEDRDFRAAISDLLGDYGFDVIGAANGQEAMDALRSGPLPHAAIIDLMVLVVDGFEVLTPLQSNAEIPIFVLSTSLRNRPAQRLRYLPKPFDVQDLLRQLGECGVTPHSDDHWRRAL